MDKLDLPSDEIVPLASIAPGVVGVRVLFVNVFAVVGASGWTLVDAGLHGSAGRIREWARGHFGDTPPEAIVLTHGHFDHVGALDGLLEKWDVPVYAHRDELGYLTGQRSYPSPDPSVGGGLMARLAFLYPRGPIDIGARLRVVVRTANGERSIHRTVRSGGSFGASPLRREIGLGEALGIERVEIRWPSGGAPQILDGLEMDHHHAIREGQPRARRLPLKSYPLGGGRAAE